MYGASYGFRLNELNILLAKKQKKGNLSNAKNEKMHEPFT